MDPFAAEIKPLAAFAGLPITLGAKYLQRKKTF